MKRKKRNKYPFILLLVIHSALLIYTFIKKKDRRTIGVLLMANMGMAYIFEYFILHLFRAYRYKPKILKNEYFDNFLGAILSQAIYIPFTGVFLSAFKLKWKVKSLFIFYFHIIERLFLHLKIYKTRWWNPVTTSILLPIYFFLSDKWYEQLQKRNPIILFVSLFLAIMGTGFNIVYLAALTGNVRFGRGRIHKLEEHFNYAPLYSMVLSLFAAWIIRKGRWIGRGGILLFCLFVDWILFRLKIVKKNFAFPCLNVILHLFMIEMSAFYQRLIYNGLKKENPTAETKIKSQSFDKILKI
ncbi:hypothetical protein ABE096_09815 [Robertmurraya massiliosenegalensis]|uniref:hypothetical protein n=1 Tax=Robertmurraya TaxID=2837507 RepID=UPI0039A5F127